MKVTLLHEAEEDFKWWRRYYRTAFPEGRLRAAQYLDVAVQMLQENPLSGTAVEGTSLRQLRISKTPFSLIYRVSRDEIKIARLWDGRQNPDKLHPRQ